jgi:hypothetical protein
VLIGGRRPDLFAYADDPLKYDCGVMVSISQVAGASRLEAMPVGQRSDQTNREDTKSAKGERPGPSALGRALAPGSFVRARSALGVPHFVSFASSRFILIRAR